MTFLSPIQVARFAGDTGDWTLTEDLVYRGNRDTFRVPKGFKTDFASIPRIFQALVPKNGSHDAAAIIHDYLYRVQPLVQGQKPLRNMRTVTRREADGIFRRIMKESGTNPIRYNLMYLGVRLGGWVAWRQNRGKLQA